MTMRSIYGPPTELPPMLLKGSTSYGNIPLTMDAASEQVHMIGEVILPGGPGTSKTFSATSSKIHWRTGSVTWATSGTTVRVGIQNVSTSTSPAQGDGTFRVYKDLVQGTDSLATNTAYATAMATNTSGAVTVTHGQLLAICWSMTTRNGADSVPVQTNNPAYGSAAYLSPAVMLATPAFARQVTAPTFIMEFDDGTIGWFASSSACLAGGSTVAYNSGTLVADEYGNLFIPAAPHRALGLAVNVNIGTAACDFEMCLYSDPLGSATFIDKIVVDGTQLATAAGTGIVAKPFTSSIILNPSTVYGLTVRPTTVNNVTMSYQDVVAASHWMSMGGTADRCYAIRRLDNTGSFSDYNGGSAMTRRFNMAFLVDQFNDSAGNAQYHIGI